MIRAIEPYIRCEMPPALQVVRNKFTDKLQTGGSAERREITIMKRRRLMMTLTAAVLAAT